MVEKDELKKHVNDALSDVLIMKQGLRAFIIDAEIRLTGILLLDRKNILEVYVCPKGYKREMVLVIDISGSNWPHIVDVIVCSILDYYNKHTLSLRWSIETEKALHVAVESIRRDHVSYVFSPTPGFSILLYLTCGGDLVGMIVGIDEEDNSKTPSIPETSIHIRYSDDVVVNCFMNVLKVHLNNITHNMKG